MYHIHLPDNHSGRCSHRGNNQRNIQLTELPLGNLDTLLPQYIPPEQPCQRCTYRKRERPIVGSDREGVNGSVTLFRIESVPQPGDPNLEDSCDEDGCPNVGSTYLCGGQAVVRGARRGLTLHKIQAMMPIPAVTPTTPVLEAHHAHPFANSSTQPFLVRP